MYKFYPYITRIETILFGNIECFVYASENKGIARVVHVAI